MEAIQINPKQIAKHRENKTSVYVCFIKRGDRRDSHEEDKLLRPRTPSTEGMYDQLSKTLFAIISVRYCVYDSVE